MTAAGPKITGAPVLIAGRGPDRPPSALALRSFALLRGIIGVSLGVEPMNNNHLSARGHLHGVGRALMLAVLLTPWIFGYSDSHAAIVNHIAFTAALGPVALLIGVLRPAAKVLLLGGVWLVLSPWLLG